MVHDSNRLYTGSNNENICTADFQGTGTKSVSLISIILAGNNKNQNIVCTGRFEDDLLCNATIRQKDTGYFQILLSSSNIDILQINQIGKFFFLLKSTTFDFSYQKIIFHFYQFCIHRSNSQHKFHQNSINNEKHKCAQVVKSESAH